MTILAIGEERSMVVDAILGGCTSLGMRLLRRTVGTMQKMKP